MRATAPLPVKLSPRLQALLCCPVCKSAMRLGDAAFHCTSSACRASFPVVDGIPILLNEANSLFSIDHFVKRHHTTFVPQPKLEALATRIIPEIGANLKAARNYALFGKLILERHPRPTVLVVGGGIVGRGLQALLAIPNIDFIETDLSFGPRTTLVCDAHDLPFADCSIDGVIIQAVLEHVLDPYRCVAEIHRVLKEGGLLYAETPFMQQVHGGPYDFTRFTYLGHRRLFRNFEQMSAGATGGPGMALAWAYQYFLLSFVRQRKARLLTKAFARLTSFWLKYFDYYLIDQPGALDAASGYFFLGTKATQPLADRALIGLYRGAGAALPMADGPPKPAGGRAIDRWLAR